MQIAEFSKNKFQNRKKYYFSATCATYYFFTVKKYIKKRQL